MKLRKISKREKFFEKPFWKKSKPILVGLAISLLGIIGYLGSVLSNKTATNYWGGNTLAPSVLVIFIGGVFILFGLIKLIKNSHLTQLSQIKH